MTLKTENNSSESIETHKQLLINVPKIKMLKRPLNQLEGHVIQAINDLESNNNIGEFSDLHNIAITSVKEIVVHPCRKAILITVPYRLIKNIQSIQSRLVMALTKKILW